MQALVGIHISISHMPMPFVGVEFAFARKAHECWFLFWEVNCFLLRRTHADSEGIPVKYVLITMALYFPWILNSIATSGRL